MRPGPARGETATLEVTVTAEMCAAVGAEQVHAVYGTVALAGHVEQVCRRLLVAHLEPNEEGVGAQIELSQRAPVPVGETVELTASVARVGPKELICEVLVRHQGTLVARGSFDQRVVDRAVFEAEIAARRTADTVS